MPITNKVAQPPKVSWLICFYVVGLMNTGYDICLNYFNPSLFGVVTGVNVRPEKCRYNWSWEMNRFQQYTFRNRPWSISDKKLMLQIRYDRFFLSTVAFSKGVYLCNASITMGLIQQCNTLDDIWERHRNRMHAHVHIHYAKRR